VALYGEVAAEMYQGVADIEGAAYYDNALRLRDMGRLLLATEVRPTRRRALDTQRMNQNDLSCSYQTAKYIGRYRCTNVGISVYFLLMTSNLVPSCVRSVLQKHTGTYRHQTPLVYLGSIPRITSPRWWA
jgi:hypothetical protein